MSQKTIILTVILFALIVIGMFVYAKLRTAEMRQQTVTVLIEVLPFI